MDHVALSACPHSQSKEIKEFVEGDLSPTRKEG